MRFSDAMFDSWKETTESRGKMLQDSRIHDNPTDTIDMKGEKRKDKVNGHSTQYTRKKDIRV